MPVDSNYAPRGKVAFIVLSPEGLPVAYRQARNIVLRNGAGLIAKLFAGAPNAVAVNQVRVGFATEAASTDVTSLTPPPGNITPEQLSTAIEPQDFTIITDQANAVKVTVSATFKPT